MYIIELISIYTNTNTTFNHQLRKFEPSTTLPLLYSLRTMNYYINLKSIKLIMNYDISIQYITL